MKHFLAIFLLAACAATGYGQTIKTLGYNTTNGRVVYSGTNTLTWTNNLWLTNSNVTSISNYILAIGTTNTGFTGTGGGASDVAFRREGVPMWTATSGGLTISTTVTFSGQLSFQYGGGALGAIAFTGISAATGAAISRTNLGLPWGGLTNTNAATFQGALFAATNAAPTNTNAPTPDAWVDITVGTNVFKLPLWQ